MRTRPTTPRRGRLLLACLLSVALLTLAGCSASEADGTQPTGAGDTSPVPSAPPTHLKYVALGDSYAAAPLVPVTDVANGCFRSSSNYPSIVAKKLGADLDDRACAGAETRDFRRSQFPDVPAQLTALNPKVDLVTVGMGGNDEHVFGRLVGQCPAQRDNDPEGAPCEAFMASKGPDALLTSIDRTQAKLIAMLREVKTMAPNAKVLVVGYPQIVSADDTCRELPLARGDYAYAEKVNLALTEMLRNAAQATRTTYVDVWKASRGHDICSDDPWINGSVDDEKQAARYHPFANEQAAVANLVLEKAQR